MNFFRYKNKIKPFGKHYVARIKNIIIMRTRVIFYFLFSLNKLHPVSFFGNEKCKSVILAVIMQYMSTL